MQATKAVQRRGNEAITTPKYVFVNVSKVMA